MAFVGTREGHHLVCGIALQKNCKRYFLNCCQVSTSRLVKRLPGITVYPSFMVTVENGGRLDYMEVSIIGPRRYQIRYPDGLTYLSSRDTR